MDAGLGKSKCFYERDIDKLIKYDDFGRKSRLLVSKENIESVGLEYHEGRCIKIKVSPDFIGNLDKVRKLSLVGQYLCYRGLSPKIYDCGVVTVGGIEYPYFDVEYIANKKNSNDTNKIKDEVRKELNKLDWITKVYEVDLINQDNYIGNKYIDFHGFEIDDDKFYRWIVGLINNNTHWGHKNEAGNKFAYQDFDGVIGKRRIEDRIVSLGADKIDYRGKTVLDIGCNLGLIANYAMESGASRSVGVDLKPVIEAADMYKLHKGYKTELYYSELTDKNITQYGKFDIVFFLAMSYSLGIPKELAEITEELLVYEGHDREDKEKTSTKLNAIFKRVVFAGFTNDRGKRPTFICYKK